MDNTNIVELDVEVASKTEKAIYVRIDTRTLWIPLSVIKHIEDEGLFVQTTIHVEKWFALKEQLVPDTASGMSTLLPQRADRSRAMLLADALVTGLRSRLDTLRVEIADPDSTHELVVADAICECGECPGDRAVLAWHAAQYLEESIDVCAATLDEIASKS